LNPEQPNISGVIAFAEAIRFADDIGMQVIFDHEKVTGEPRTKSC